MEIAVTAFLLAERDVEVDHWRCEIRGQVFKRGMRDLRLFKLT